MALHVDPARGSDIGERVSVGADLFADAVAELVADGARDVDARRRLVDEGEWGNVEQDARTDPEPLCLHCRAPVSAGRQCCDVLCEAAFIAEVHG